VDYRKAILIVWMLFGCHLVANSALSQSAGCPVSTITQSVQYDESWRLQWDPSNPQQVYPDEPIEIRVLNGRPPFTWEVVEGEFSLAYTQTYDRTNILSADSAACGTATISCIDGYGDQVEGEVRRAESSDDNSRWVYYGDTCLLPGYAATNWRWNPTAGTDRVTLSKTVIVGGIKQQERLRGRFRYVNCGDGYYFGTEGELDACKAQICQNEADICMTPDLYKYYSMYPNSGDYYWCGKDHYFSDNQYSGKIHKWKSRRVHIDGFGIPANVSVKEAWRWECE
jgi:hypothetical protein